MPVDGLGLFERLLALPDPDLQDMILHPELAPAGEFAELVAAMRAFHGLEERAMTGSRSMATRRSRLPMASSGLERDEFA